MNGLQPSRDCLRSKQKQLGVEKTLECTKKKVAEGMGLKTNRRGRQRNDNLMKNSSFYVRMNNEHVITQQLRKGCRRGCIASSRRRRRRLRLSQLNFSLVYHRRSTKYTPIFQMKHFTLVFICLWRKFLPNESQMNSPI